MRVARLPSLAAALGVSSLQLAHAQPPLAPKVVEVTPASARRPAEVSVAINPNNADHVVAVMMQSGGPGEPRVSNWTYVSVDGGITWKGAPVQNADQRVQGDDVVVFGRDGMALHAYISFDGIRVERPERASSGIYVRSSKDGIVWNAPVAVVDHINTAIPFEDKPWLGIDRGTASPHRGNIYVAWTRFDVYGSENPAHRSHIMISRSRDGGRTFSTPLEISDDTGDARDSDDTVEGAVPASAPNGDVYIAWAGPNGIYFDKSVDGGWTFGKDVVITAMPGGWDSPVPGLERHNGMPVTAVDLSAGANNGSVYVNWIDARNGDLDVFVASSRDGGRSWSPPVRVGDDGKGTQMFTWMAVDPVDGAVNVVYHDRKGAAATAPTGVTLARSVDGGRTFKTFPVPIAPFQCCSASSFFGDYNGIDAYGGRVVALFPVLTATGQQRVHAAVARFRPGTQELQ